MVVSWHLRENIILLQGYYKFLYLWKYLEGKMKKFDLSKNVVDMKIETWKQSHFLIKGKVVAKMLSDIHQNPDKKNIFWYLMEISAFKWMFSVMRELLDTNIKFRNFVQMKLKDQYFPFEQIIKLTRNVLSHTTTANINLKTDDFIKQKDYLKNQKDPVVKFQFIYSKYFPEWKWSQDYGLNILLDFRKFKDGQPFFEIISIHQLYLLSELCFNISEIFRLTNKIK